MRRTVEIVSVNGNATAAGRKSILMPVGFDYIAARLQGVTAVSTNVSILQELINTEIVRNITGVNQNDMNLLDKMANMSVDFILPMPFEMMGMKNPAQQYSTTRNTGSPDPDTGNQITNMQLQWVDSTTDTWRVFADVDDSQVGGPGGITRFDSLSAAIGSSATFTSSIAQFLQFGSPERRYMRRGLFLASTGTLANGDTVIMKGKNKGLFFQRTATGNVRALTDANLRAVPTNYITASGGYIIDGTETGISETWDTMRPATAAEIKADTDNNIPAMAGIKVKPEAMFDIRFSPTAANTLACIIETIGRL